MGAVAIVGANWGDEGKGKITDHLAASSDFVVRYQGGSNAGHTIINHLGKFALHLLPSGVFYPHITNVVGPGVALNVNAFQKEWTDLIGRGVPTPKLAISNRAQLLLPHHVLFDQAEEERLGARKFGSTRTGIAPFYADKFAKIGIQANDLFHEEHLRSRIGLALERHNVLLEHLYGLEPLDPAQIVAQALTWRPVLEPFLTDTTSLLHAGLAAGKQVLLEGQLGALRDPDHGIYPFSTSSSPLAGYAPVGAGIPPAALTRVIAVVKAYSSCVGAGPFVSEIHGEEAHDLRERGGDKGEYGATTGRPRRMGWFDAVATRYGCQVQGATEVALTLLDVLGYLDRIPMCVGYKIGDSVIESFPTTPLLERATPVLDHLPGWRADLREVRRFEDLPAAAQGYVHVVEEQIGVPVRWVSVGPHRDALIER